jgi:hypothetical protein
MTDEEVMYWLRSDEKNDRNTLVYGIQGYHRLIAEGRKNLAQMTRERDLAIAEKNSALGFQNHYIEARDDAIRRSNQMCSERNVFAGECDKLNQKLRQVVFELKNAIEKLEYIGVLAESAPNPRPSHYAIAKEAAIVVASLKKL